MSVRAHRIVEIKYAPEGTSFNLTFDEKLVQFLDDHNEGGLWSQLHGDGGIACIEVKAIRQAIRKASQLSLDADTVEALRRDISAGRKLGYVDYDFF